MAEVADLLLYLLENKYNTILIGVGLLYLFPLLAFTYTIIYIRRSLEKNTKAINALVALIIDEKQAEPKEIKNVLEGGN